MNKFIVITSIFPPTEAVEKFAAMKEWQVIVVADKKSPESWQYENVKFISVEEQMKGLSPLSSALPWNTYTRKNIGYEFAIQNGADIIYDTDDDNIPLENWIQQPSFSGEYLTLSEAEFVNVYSLFTSKHVWPRGFPLPLILNPQIVKETQQTQKIGVWQYLADEDPDVDAIYRLIDNTPIYFEKHEPVVLEAGTVSPFNSQNTYFRQETFPLLYLPSTVTFRFTDILRGLVAQPILWAAGYTLGVGGSTVIQKRNPHNYLKDFESEVPVFLLSQVVSKLAAANALASRSISENLMEIYKALEKQDIVKAEELDLLTLWLKNFS